MSIATDQDADVGLLDSFINAVSFSTYKHPVDYYMVSYMVVDRSMWVDLMLNHHDFVGFLSILEGNLTKHFLPKRITNFDTNIRTTVSVSGTCCKYTPTKAPGKSFGRLSPLHSRYLPSVVSGCKD